MRLLLSVSVLALACTEANAQPAAATDAVASSGRLGGADFATTITPDVAADRTMGTTVVQSGNAYMIDGGRTAGQNLFHSFTNFDLARGDVARWTHTGGDSSDIANVINRVTGGDPSHIFGTLDSTALPNADFYFINPAGIVFGEGASVNVPAAAHFSTASELRFASGSAFQVAEPNGTLSIAPPEAFGFLGGQGSIVISQADGAFMGGDGALMLSSANIEISGSGTPAEYRPPEFRPEAGTGIAAGQIMLAAVGGGAAKVTTDGGVEAPEGTVRIAGSSLLASPSAIADGSIGIAAGNVVIVASSLFTDAGDASTADTGGSIVIAATRNILVAGAELATFTSGTADAGNIGLFAPLIELTDVEEVDQLGTLIQTSTSGPGNAGSILIAAADELNVFSRGFFNFTTVASNTTSSGNAGLISLRAPRLYLSSADILADGFAINSGDAGEIEIIAAKSLELVGTIVQARTTGPGNAGDILLQAPDLTVRESLISSTASLMQLDKRSPLGDAGSITLEGDRIRVADAAVSTGTNGVGDGGSIRIAASEWAELQDSDVASSTNGAGDGGDIYIGAPELFLTGVKEVFEYEVDGEIVSESFFSLNIDASASGAGSAAFDVGDAGSVTLEATRLEIRGASISTSFTTDCVLCLREGVNAGSISLSATTLLLEDSRLVSDTDQGGPGGDITLVATERAALSDFEIFSRTFGSGDGGNIRIRAPQILLRGERVIFDGFGAGSIVTSFVTSDTFGSGDAGSITLEGQNVSIENVSVTSLAGPRPFECYDDCTIGNAGQISIAAETLSVADSDLITDASGEGVGGDITLRSSAEVVLTGTVVSSRTEGSGRGGNILVAAPKIVFQRGAERNLPITETSRIDARTALTASTAGSGDAGTITIVGDEVDLSDSDLASESELCVFEDCPTGNSGRIIIDAGTLQARELQLETQNLGLGDDPGGEIRVSVSGSAELSGFLVLADTFGSDDAGRVLIEVGGKLAISDSLIESRSLGIGDAGSISIEAGEISLDDVLILSDATSGTGAAGAVEIASRGDVLLDRSEISTDSSEGAAGDISFALSSGSLLVLRGPENDPTLITTSSGPGTGGRITIGSPFAIVADGSRVLALGQSGGANVLIDTQFFITSADRPNLVAVDGTLQFENPVTDVSAGTVEADLAVLDASGVLRGQCPAVRASGRFSQLSVRPTGPYAVTRRPPATAEPAPSDASMGAGDCR